MRQPLVMANWKSNGSLAQAKTISEQIAQHYLAESPNTEVCLCVPYPYIMYVKDIVAKAGISVGAENVSQYTEGAYTGEVSASMLADIGAEYVIVGHSERRTLFGEDNRVVSEKVQRALQHGLKVVLCIGETLQQRQDDQIGSVISQQLDSVINDLSSDDMLNITVAYEPVWAIGTGLAATPEQVNEVHAYIRKVIAKNHTNLENQIRIVYGGSVNSGNAAQIFNLPDVDGGLIGGASLKPKDFNQIILQAEF